MLTISHSKAQLHIFMEGNSKLTYKMHSNTNSPVDKRFEFTFLIENIEGFIGKVHFAKKNSSEHPLKPSNTFSSI